MKCEEVSPGVRVRVAALNDTRGMLVSPGYLANRQLDATGVVAGHVPGHGGDVWCVLHEDGLMAPYCYDELEATA